MKISHLAADDVSVLLDQLSDISAPRIALCYATRSAAALETLCEQVQQHLPEVAVIGITTDEVIVDGRISQADLVVSLISLEEADFALSVWDQLDDGMAARSHAWLSEQKEMCWWPGVRGRRQR